MDKPKWWNRRYKNNYKDGKLQIVFEGFESLYDLSEDVEFAVIAFMELREISSEFTGTLKVIFDYEDENVSA